MEHIIKKATIFDLKGLQRLEKLCFTKDAWPFFDLVAVLTFPGVIRLKATRSNQMVGFIAGDIRNADSLAWIATLAVDPAFQNQGIGFSLLQECEKQLLTPQIRLCLRPENSPAFNLYSKAGYKTIDRWKGYYNDKSDAIVMEKRGI
ncbi:MAG: GNAT family N-acetyltransferase [Anaerolineales bacterium]